MPLPSGPDTNGGKSPQERTDKVTKNSWNSSLQTCRKPIRNGPGRILPGTNAYPVDGILEVALDQVK